MNPEIAAILLLSGAFASTKRLQHIRKQTGGRGLFQLACDRDLEGIVTKWKFAPYLLAQPSSWVKIRNRGYSQWVGREELFDRERGGDPDFREWDGCARACAGGSSG